MGETEAPSPPKQLSEPGSRRKLILVGLLVVLLAAGTGVGAYLYGKSKGEDLDAARAEGTAAGQAEGAAQGAEQGYAQGFKEGRRKGYNESYDNAYRAAYRETLEEEGFEVTPRELAELPSER